MTTDTTPAKKHRNRATPTVWTLPVRMDQQAMLALAAVVKRDGGTNAAAIRRAVVAYARRKPVDKTAKTADIRATLNKP